MNKSRLLTLAAFLEALPRKAFSLKAWVIEKKNSYCGEEELDENVVAKLFTAKRNMKNGLTPTQMISCGTTACAVGWAGSIPAFKKEGFCIYVNEERMVAIPRFQEYKNWYAVKAFFDISYWESHKLFSISYYDQKDPTPKQVAKVIRKFVAQAQQNV